MQKQNIEVECSLLRVHTSTGAVQGTIQTEKT